MSDEITTSSSPVFRRLREEILSGHLRPGDRLRVDSLRERYSVGGSPIRDALMRLESEGFVRLEQNKGFRVSAVSREDLLDVSRTRSEIESIALRWSIENGGMEWEGDVVGALHRLNSVDKTDRSGDGSGSSAWLRYHRAFHLALISACESPTMIGIYQRLFDQAERYVALSIKETAEIRDDVAEHREIAEAALARDADGAVDLARRHIARTTAKLERHHSAGP